MLKCSVIEKQRTRYYNVLGRHLSKIHDKFYVLQNMCKRDHTIVETYIGKIPEFIDKE